MCVFFSILFFLAFFFFFVPFYLEGDFDSGDSGDFDFGVIGWAQWLTLVIPALWEAGQVDCLNPRVQDQPGQRGETLES